VDATDLLTIMEWMMPRWTDVAAWEAPEWEAFRDDLDDFTAGQVLTALHRLWRNGREKAPRAGTVLALLRELDVRPLPLRQQLPDHTYTAPTQTLAEFADIHYGSWERMWDAIREGTVR